MITLTTEAVTAIHELVADHPGAGLRILPRSVEDGTMQLGLELTTDPAPSDEVVVEHGSRVFIDEQVAPHVDGKTLDAQSSEESGLRFRLIP